MFGLITGSGFYDIPELTDRSLERIDTPFGGPVEVTTGSWRGLAVCFIPRHGADHSVPPHGINYRANIAALKAIGATSIVATAVSGGIHPEMTPGAIVVISDFLNFSSGRDVTFYDGSKRPIVAGPAADTPPSDSSLSDQMVKVVHADMSAAYHPGLRATIVAAAEDESIPVIDGGVYCTFDGPRFETPAEIAMAKAVGGDLVGMTGFPEVALAVEAGIPYASIGVISNLAAGISDEPLSAADIMTLIDTTAEPLYRLIARTAERVGEHGLGD